MYKPSKKNLGELLDRWHQVGGTRSIYDKRHAIRMAAWPHVDDEMYHVD
jgi:hypothetical protein